MPKLLTVVPSHPAAATGSVPALRAATRSHHDRVDRLVDLRRLRERAHYIRILQVFDRFHEACEQRVLEALPPARHDWLRRRSRLPFLQQDLRVLGAGRLPAVLPAPPLSGAASAWGSVYVLEGSALGGQLITRSLAQHGLGPDSGAAYFHGWGAATGRMWSETRLLLERELAVPQQLAQACEAARATFDTLSLHLETALDERAAAG